MCVLDDEKRKPLIHSQKSLQPPGLANSLATEALISLDV